MGKKYIKLVGDDNFHCCFLDEKCFFCSSNRKKYKILPHNKAIGGMDADAYVPVPRLHSRRKPCKAMLIFCVAAPVPEIKLVNFFRIGSADLLVNLNQLPQL